MRTISMTDINIKKNKSNEIQNFTWWILVIEYTTYHCRYCEKEIIINNEVYYRCGWCSEKFWYSCWDNENVVEERIFDNFSKKYCHFCTRLHICSKCDAKICGLCKKIHIDKHDKMTIENKKSEGKKGTDLLIPDNKSFGSDLYDY